MFGENFMGTKQLTDNYKRNTPGQSEETAPKKVGDKVTYRSIRTKKKRTSTIKKVEKTKAGWRYEMSNTNFVYHADLDEAVEKKKVIDTYSPKGRGWDGDEYELIDDKSYQSIIKTKQGGKSLKNKWGGYTSFNIGTPAYIKKKWKELKKHYDDPNVSSGGYHMRKIKKESIDEQFEDLEINEAVKKIACLECDAVSTEKAWKKNKNFCPKCKKSNKGVAEETISPKIQSALEEKALFSKIPVDILSEVYLRGRADYNQKMVITEDQWAFGRVNNFIAGGKTRSTEDADLWNEISKRNR